MGAAAAGSRVVTAYCPGCLDVWCIETARFTRGDSVIWPGISLHVSCGRALESIRATPPTSEVGS
jgi:hypothetical protein